MVNETAMVLFGAQTLGVCIVPVRSFYTSNVLLMPEKIFSNQLVLGGEAWSRAPPWHYCQVGTW